MAGSGGRGGVNMQFTENTRQLSAILHRPRPVHAFRRGMTPFGKFWTDSENAHERPALDSAHEPV